MNLVATGKANPSTQERYTSGGGSAAVRTSSAFSSTSEVSTGAFSILNAVILCFAIDSAKPNFPPSFLCVVFVGGGKRWGWMIDGREDKKGKQVNYFTLW